MTIHLIFVFSLILTVILLLIFIIFYAHYHRLKSLTSYHSMFKNRGLIIFFFTYFWLITPIFILAIVSYILVLTFPQQSITYLFLVVNVINYVLIFIYLLSLTFLMNCLWIKTDDTFIHFLDESIYLQEIIGLQQGKIINKVLYQVDGEINKKRVIGKKITNYLISLE